MPGEALRPGHTSTPANRLPTPRTLRWGRGETLRYRSPAGQGKPKERNAPHRTPLCRGRKPRRKRDGVEGLRPAGEARQARRCSTLSPSPGLITTQHAMLSDRAFTTDSRRAQDGHRGVLAPQPPPAPTGTVSLVVPESRGQGSRHLMRQVLQQYHR